MRIVNQDFIDAIEEQSLKLAELFIIELAGGEVYRYTTHDTDITWDAGGNTYTSTTMARSPIEFTNNFESDNVKVFFGNLEGDFYDKVQKDILESVKVTIKRILWNETYAADLEITLFSGFADIDFDRQVLTFTCRPVADTLNLQIPKNTYQEPCNNSLYDNLCGLSRLLYAYAGTATGGSNLTLTDTGRGRVYKVPFDGGDEDNPLVVGDTFGSAGNDFSTDSDCMAVFELDNGALTADSQGTNTLTNSGVTNDTSDYKRGDACGVFSSSDRLEITDANLDANFPLKNGDANKKISITAWVKFSSLPTTSQWQIIASKWYSAGGSRSYGVGIYNNAGTVRFSFLLGYNGGASTESIVGSAMAVAQDKWYHVGFTYQDSDKSYKIRIYDLDAATAYEDTGNTTNNINVEDAAFNLGRYVVGGYLQGRLDEVAVFKDILTSNEIDDIRSNVYGVSTEYDLMAISYETASTGYLWYTNGDEGDIPDDTVWTTDGNTVIINGTPAVDATFYEQGELQMTSGDNDGLRRPVLSDINSILTVIWPFPNAVEIGDTYNVYPGCDKRATTCLNRFDNADQFAGFLYIPKIEDVML